MRQEKRTEIQGHTRNTMQGRVSAYIALPVTADLGEQML